jgi:hypothetical protein
MTHVRSSSASLVLGLLFTLGCGSSDAKGPDGAGSADTGAIAGSDGATSTGGSGGKVGSPSDGGGAGTGGDGSDAATSGGPDAAVLGGGGMDGGDASGGAGAGGASGGMGGTGGVAACNTFPISAPMVHPVVGGGPGIPVPIAAGGVIVAGTYFLTKYENYKGEASNATYQTVLAIKDGEIQLAQLLNGEETRATLQLTTATNKFKAVYTCGPTLAIGAQLAYDEYTASPTQLLLFGKDRVLTLTLQ